MIVAFITASIVAVVDKYEPDVIVTKKGVEAKREKETHDHDHNHDDHGHDHSHGGGGKTELIKQACSMGSILEPMIT